ncbi:MAG: hypothetical protein ABI378_01790 [Chitinophagaceae bacterium]
MKLLTGLLFLLCSIQVTAQQILFSSSENFDFRNGDYSVVGKVEGKLYTYRAGNDGYFLDAYDDSMKRTATVVLDFFPAKIYQTQFITYPDKIIVLYQANERGKIIQYAARLNAKGLLQGKPIILDDARTSIFGASGNYFSSTISEDKKMIAIYSASSKGRRVNVSCSLLNEFLEKQGHFEKKYEGESSLNPLPALLDNDGNFYLPLSSNSGSNSYSDGVWLLKMEKGGTRFTSHALNLNGNFASGLFFKIDNNTKHLYAVGFYADKRNSSYDGVLFSKMNLDSLNASPARLLAFNDKLKEATGHGKRRAFNDYQSRQLIIRNDGGFVLVAEEYYTSYRNIGMGYGGYYSAYYSPFMNTQTIREYHYGDIVALSYDAAGNREFSSFIRKDQYSEEDGGAFSSYTFINSGGSLGFLYNDYDNRRSQITFAAVDATGRIDTHGLYSVGSSDPDWLPKAGKQVSARELVVPCLRKKQICFAKVVF